MWKFTCRELLSLFASGHCSACPRSTPRQNPLSFGKKEKGLELRELTSLFHTPLGCFQGWPVSSPDPTVLHKYPQPRGSGDQQLPTGCGVVPTATSELPRSGAEGLRVILGALRAVPQVTRAHTVNRAKNKVRTGAGWVWQEQERAGSSSSALGESVSGVRWPAGPRCYHGAWHPWKPCCCFWFCCRGSFPARKDAQNGKSSSVNNQTTEVKHNPTKDSDRRRHS